MNETLRWPVLFLVVPLLVVSLDPPVTTAAEDRVLQAALDDLAAPAVAVRVHAARRLERAPHRGATSALLAALSDSDAAVRREVAKALGALKDPQTVTALVTALQDADTNVRLYAAYALGELKDPAAVNPLLACLADPQWLVRDQAAWSLREIGGQQLVERLVDMLAGESVDVKQLAWILRGLEREAVLARLSRILKVPPPVRSNQASARVRQRIVMTLGTFPDSEVVPLLVQSLADPAERVRHQAVVVLGARRDPRALEPLDAVARNDEELRIRDAARRAADGLSGSGDLQAHWDFEELAGKVVPDVTGNGNDGQRKGCQTVPGKVGQALKCGPGSFVELDRPAEMPVGNKPFTVMAWVKTQATDGVVVARGGAFCGYSLYLKDGAPKFGIHRIADGPGFVAASTSWRAGEWVHLAGVVKQKRIELYVDGRLAASTETTGYLPNECGQGMEIGFDVGNSAAEIVTPWTGLIDEVKVFGVALSPRQLAAEVAAATKPVNK